MAVGNTSKIRKLLVGALAGVGVAALVLGGMIASPVRQPPELKSISTTGRAVDRSGMPALERFEARDGTALAMRHYSPTAPVAAPVAIAIHGSSAASFNVHALAKALAAKGVETFAPDIRGHGASGARGDVSYPGQLEDDLADLVGKIRETRPDAPITLIGLSSGGGFALRIAGSPIQDLFARTVLLAPFLGWKAPTSREDAGGWASPNIPRIVGLTILSRIGIPCCESLPVIAFAVPPNSTSLLTAQYSFRLLREFAASRDYRDDIAAARKPISLLAGAADELMFADRYQDAVGARIPVKLIDGVNHLGIVSDPAALSAIVDDVVTAGTGS
uniref:Alpha/beta hydrolase n=1 Tax=Rhodopseudomonas palustris (strain BisA53) TaxID=316055 RepID=Q07HP8_RHOP5